MDIIISPETVGQWENLILPSLTVGSAALLTQQHWSDRAKRIVSGVLAAVLAFFGMLITGQLTSTVDVVGVAFAVYLAATGLYHTIYKPLGKTIAARRTPPDNAI